MSSLFSTFDPQSWFYFNLNWNRWVYLLALGLGATLLNSPTQKLITASLNAVKNEFNATTLSTVNKRVLYPCIALFFLIFLANTSGLLPYSFTLSSHLRATASLALPLWMGHILLGTLLTPSNLLSHVVPLGAPNALIPFIVLIELVRNIIRPLTLSVRLAANIIAGHLLIRLLGQSIFPSFSTTLALCIFAIFLLCALERGVRIIQAYVFALLSSLYINEIQTTNL